MKISIISVLVILLFLTVTFNAKSLLGLTSQAGIMLPEKEDTVKDQLKNSFKIYKPLWSVSKNNGSLPPFSLCPLNLESDRDFKLSEFKSIESKNISSDVNPQKKRTPLILIHGTVSDYYPFCNWQFLVSQIRLPEEADFAEAHDIYIFRYPTNVGSLAEVSEKLAKGIEELLSDYPDGTGYKVVISSLGGNVFCKALNDNPEIDRRLIKAVSLGTPFWGTPLLNENLIVGSNNKDPINNLLYQSVDILFPAMSRDLEWSLPTQPIDDAQNQAQQQIEFSCLSLRNKSVNYGAYLNSPINQNGTAANEEEIQSWLKSKMISLDYKNAWNSFMHYKMGHEIERKIENNLSEPIYLFPYNDGLVPIYSSLWLNPNTNRFAKKRLIDEEVIKEIKLMNSHARLFEGVDHTSLTPKRKNTPIKDILANSTESLTMAKWILKDLR
jgi:hypothetical protein